MMTSLPIEDIINSEGNQNIASLLFNVIKAFTVINVLLSAFLSLIPVWLSVKATGYCEMHDELKEKNGYPFFHPDIALQSMTEEIENQKTHRLQTDTKMAVTNAQLMDRLREQKVDIKDTDALIAGIIENSGSEQKDTRSSANVVDMVDSMFDSARKSASGSSKSRFATSDMNSVSGIFGKLTQISGTKKETENSLAMKALVKEAERLRQKKQFQSQNDDRRF
jgi:hypothetical protein